MKTIKSIQNCKQKMIQIKIVYFIKKSQYIKTIRLKYGSLVKEALITSNIIYNKNINITHDNVGIYGELVSVNNILHDGDRIEIYKPLKIDPKELRRKKVLQKINKKKK